jgi:hypothetical protein
VCSAASYSLKDENKFYVRDRKQQQVVSSKERGCQIARKEKEL